MKTDILLVGDTSIDEFMLIHEASVSCDINHEHCQICFDYADKVHVEEFKSSVAGNAPNVAIGCATLGMKPTLYTEIGGDSNADLAINTMKERGVDTTYCIKNPGTPTNVHPIAVFKGERTIFSYHEKRDYKMQDWEEPKFIYYSSLSEGFEKFHDELHEYVKEHKNIIFAVNPGTMQMKVGINKLREMTPRMDVLFVNKEEAQGLVGSEDDIDTLHKKLTEMGVKLSVITDGINGSSTHDGTTNEKIGIYKTNLEIKDKTGAGDAFAAGFISAMHYGKNAKEAMKWGSINSSGVVAEIGAIEGLRTKKEVEKILKDADFTEPKL
jgi:sugar/nucleoside kinase (ribokinase family)